jgi:hypothetical protein
MLSHFLIKENPSVLRKTTYMKLLIRRRTYGHSLERIDVGLARSFAIREGKELQLETQVFNLFNHPNYYVQNGNGSNQLEYNPIGTNCGDGATESNLLLGAQFWLWQLRDPAGNQPQRLATNPAVLGEIYLLGGATLTFSADQLLVRHYQRVEGDGRTAHASGLAVIHRWGLIWRLSIRKILLVGRSCRVTIALAIPMAMPQLPR